MTLSDLAGFEGLDQPEVYKRCYDALNEISTRNFVVEFDEKDAIVALNLNKGSLRDFLKIDKSKAPTTRWINIFCPEQQEEHINHLARVYRLSPRLQGIIRSKPWTRAPISSGGSPNHKPKQSTQSRVDGQVHQANGEDLEKMSSISSDSTDPQDFDINHYKIVDDVWHFCSIDWSPRCLCIGFNSLPEMAVNTPEGFNDEAISKRSAFKKSFRKGLHQNNLGGNLKSKPAGKRVWTWLLLCDDGTVISIYENPFPFCGVSLEPNQQQTLNAVRRNLRNVFQQISKCNNDRRKTLPIGTLDIRPDLKPTEGSSVTTLDSPGLLFHYLFDDWYTTYALVARQGQQYANVLDRLRGRMFERAELERVDQLHQTGRQLALLKRLYQSYVLIIDQVLNRQKTPESGTEKTSGNIMPVGESPEPSGLSQHEPDDKAFKAPLTDKAVVKFERLRDRIKLYALSEIDECLEEKETLVFLNFNLITMRQSEAVEKLTRITILLAKVTILFMPVSLMTGYFSVQIEDLEGVYSARTYWICFIVIMALSFFFLVAFGVISHTLEGGLIYKSITKASMEAVRSPFKLARRGKREIDEHRS